LLRAAVDTTDGPTVIRYPKATAGDDIPALDRIGHYDLLRADPDAEALLIPVGPLAGPCLAAAAELDHTHGIPTTIADPRWTTPLNPALLHFAEQHQLALTIEDTTTIGALGSRLAQALTTANSATRAATFALPNQFLPHAFQGDILHAHGLDTDGITTTVLKRLAHTHRTAEVTHDHH
jgi:1-deoxy-D-xylulose-5-phosphate synthase